MNNNKKIKPAGPLQEMPQVGRKIYYVEFYQTIGEEIKGGYQPDIWRGNPLDIERFQNGFIFSRTISGRLGAERRAKQGILPPIDREELNRKYMEWLASDETAHVSDAIFFSYLESITEGGQAS